MMAQPQGIKLDGCKMLFEDMRNFELLQGLTHAMADDLGYMPRCHGCEALAPYALATGILGGQRILIMGNNLWEDYRIWLENKRGKAVPIVNPITENN